MTWPVVALSEVAETRLGKMLDKGKTTGLTKVPYLRNVNVQWGRIDTHDLLTMELGDHERDRFGVQAGDLLVCEGGEIGRCAIWNGSNSYVAFQKALHRVRVGDSLETRFLRHLLQHHADTGVLARLSTGSTIAHLPQQQLRRVPVPLPPIGEQRRIVEILEDHLSRLDAADQYVTDSLRRQAAFSTARLQQLIWKQPFELTTVAEVLREPMRNGRSDRASDAPNAIRTLTLTAVTRGDFGEHNTKLTSTSAEVARGLWLEPGDVFVQRSNTPELVGSSARYDGPTSWAIFPDLLIRLRPDESRMDSRFLAAALRSARAHRSLRSRARGLAGSMPKVDQRAVGETVIPLPPRDRQDEIVAHLDEMQDAGARMRDASVSALRRSAALRRAVLAVAFEGKLKGRHTDAEMIEEAASLEGRPR